MPQCINHQTIKNIVEECTQYVGNPTRTDLTVLLNIVETLNDSQTHKVTEFLNATNILKM